MVFMGGDEDELGELFASVEHAATVECEYCMPYENHQPIYVARGFRGDLEELWPSLKHYD